MSGATLANRLFEERLHEERDYWLLQLSGAPVPVGIPLDFERPPVFYSKKETMHMSLEEELYEHLITICGQKQSLLLAMLTAVLKICLHKYSGSEDIIVGTSIHRQHATTASVNTILALRSQIRSTDTVRHVLLTVKETLAQAYTHHRYPFESVVALSGAQCAENRETLFNIVITLDTINDPGCIAHLKTDVHLSFSVKDGRIHGDIKYNPTLFEPATLETFREHYLAILQQVLRAPEMSLAEIELLSKEKQQRFLQTYTCIRRYPRNATVIELFDRQAFRTPQHTALIFKDQQMSYEVLQARVSLLSANLSRLGVKPGTAVGIYLEHSMDMIVGVLAVLKAGGCYVPIDVDFPLTQTLFVAADAHISVLLTQRSLVGRFAVPELASVRILCCDSDWNCDVSASEGTSVEDNACGAGMATSTDIACIIYTSGSTGHPKGVKISHRALMNYVWWARRLYVGNRRSTFPLYSSLAFDLTVTSIFVPLISGNAIVVYGGDERSIDRILDDNRVDIIKLTPSHLSYLEGRTATNSRITRLIVGGEALRTELARKVWQRFNGNITIYNEYGPTEATVGCMTYRFDPERDRRAFVPIGVPADNTRIYVLDNCLKLVAENVAGELWIGGDGLAEGYLNREELTREKFIEDPFITGGTIYRTGDLARWLPEGVLEFLGRKDSQVKFNGHRLELGEISSILNQHPLVRDSIAAVLKDDQGYDVMVCYYVSKQVISASLLREFLAGYVVKEKVPNLFVHLDKLPLNLNGKVDLRNLPQIKEIRQELQHMIVAPRTEVERILADIWSNILGIQAVGIRDNFFELGGHSLMATQVIARVREALHVNLFVRSIFEAPTIEQLADLISGLQLETDQLSAADIPTIPRGMKTLEHLLDELGSS